MNKIEQNIDLTKIKIELLESDLKLIVQSDKHYDEINTALHIQKNEIRDRLIDLDDKKNKKRTLGINASKEVSNPPHT